MPHIWDVGALCHAVADLLQARFNPVSVRGEITGFSRAASGHCYFSIKDAHGQIRCAMFRRAASLLGFTPRDGEWVELRGRLGVYEQRGDLQLVVESLQRAGQGALFEQFLRLKAQLESEGLFDVARKRPLPALPRGIGLVTSLGAAALHDVVTALRRRLPHIPVVLVPALVQGAGAAPSLVAALQIAQPERLESSFAVTPAMMLHLLDRPADTWTTVRSLLMDNHEPRARQRRHARRAIGLYRSLLASGVVERLASPLPDGRLVRVDRSLQQDFALNQPLAPFLLDLLPMLDADDDGHVFAVLAAVESVLDDPRQVLFAQRERAKTEAMAAMKAVNPALTASGSPGFRAVSRDISAERAAPEARTASLMKPGTKVTMTMPPLAGINRSTASGCSDSMSCR